MYPIKAILLAATFYNLALVTIIFFRQRTNKAAMMFAWYILGTAGWSASVGMTLPQYGENTALWLTRATFFSATFIGASWVWFCAQFPRPSRHFRGVAVLLTVIGAPWLVLSWTNWAIPSVKFHPDWLEAGVGPLVLPFAAWIGACTVAGVAHLVYKVKRVRGLERLQVRYILLGAVGLAVAGSMPCLILPAITGSTRYAHFGPLASLFITTTTTYAIVRYRLMDIRIVLRAGLVYSVTIGMLSLVFALLVPMLEHVLSVRFHFPYRTGSFLMALLIALAFQPLRRYVQNLVDQRFFKSVYDYRLTLREAGSALASAHDRELLAQTLVNAVLRTLRPYGVVIFVPRHDDQLVQSSSSGPWDYLPKNISMDDPLVRFALETDEVMLAEEFIRQPEPYGGIGQRMRSWGIYVTVPLIAGNRLCGIVFLGEKLSGDVYTTDDVGLLRILGKQAAIALDNARHYDEMVLLNEYHERLLQNMQDGVIALDPEQRVITFNPAAERMTGVPIKEAQGRRLSDLGMTTLPTHPTGADSIEVALPTRQGTEIPVLVTVTPFRRRWDTADSHLLVFRDLSALRALEEEKMQAERFSSMGAMAASLAHEIKNPLVPIQTFAHLLPTHYDDVEFRQEFSATVVKEVERISRLVGQMLDLVRKPTHDRGLIQIPELLEQLFVLIRPECERCNVTVKTDIAPGISAVVGIANQLYQAILNVLMNGVQAMPRGGTLTVSVTEDEDRIICRISDTGPGVPEAELPRIFEPLYTTKVGGHGLGLALTYQFIRTNGGEIRAECPPGCGLSIVFMLPAWRLAETELVCT